MGYLLFHAAASPLMTPTPALLGDQSHSFLDNTIALFGHIRAWDCSPESSDSLIIGLDRSIDDQDLAATAYQRATDRGGKARAPLGGLEFARDRLFGI